MSLRALTRGAVCAAAAVCLALTWPGELRAQAPQRARLDSLVGVLRALREDTTLSAAARRLALVERALPLAGEVGPDTLAVRLLLVGSVNALLLDRAAAAAAYATAAAARSRALRRHDYELYAYLAAAEAYGAAGQPVDSALLYGHRAAILARTLGDWTAEDQTLEGLAVQLVRHDRGRAAVDALQRLIELRQQRGERRLEREAWFLMGAAYSAVDRPDSSRIAYERALLLQRAHGDTTTRMFMVALEGAAVQARRTGDLAGAIAHYRAAVVVSRHPSLMAYRSQVASALTDAYTSAAQYDSAARYGRLALSIAKEEGAPGRVQDALVDLIDIYAKLQRTDSVDVLLRQVDPARLSPMKRLALRLVLVELAASLGTTADPLLERYVAADDSLAHGDREPVVRARKPSPSGTERVAGTSSDVEPVERARAALAAARSQGDRLSSSVAAWQLGRALAARGERDSALVYYQHARQGLEPASLPTFLSDLAGVFGAGGTPAALGLAAVYHDSAAALAADIARQAGGELSRAEFRESVVRLTVPLVGTLLRLDRPEAALAAADRERARGVLETLPGAGSFTLPDRLDERGRALLEAMPRGQTVLAYYPLFDTLAVWVARDGRILSAVRVPVRTAALQQLAARARWAIQREGTPAVGGRTEVVEQPDPVLLAETEPADSALTRLSRLILPAPVVEALPTSGELAIVASGALAAVPLAAVPLPTREAPGQRLGTRYAVRLVPSLAWLATVGAEDQPLDAGGLSAGSLVVGNPRMPVDRERGTPFAPLPEAETEARAVASALRVAPLTGPAATETAVRSAMRTAAVVHLATHGRSFSARGRSAESFVVLAPDAANDGLLTVRELLSDAALTLRAELVVLSACESGLGEYRFAEGTLGLQRTLFAKGARRVIASLWPVRDDATRTLMSLFYRHWLGGAERPSASEALRRAQRDLASIPGYEHPYFWAGFQIAGVP